MRTRLCIVCAEEGVVLLQWAWRCHEAKCDAPRAFPSLAGKLWEVLCGLSACWASFREQVIIEVVFGFEALS